MPEKAVPVTFTFRSPGTKPPLFIAGTYSDPPWQLREMQHILDDAGEHFFTANISLEPGHKYLYNYKASRDGDWVWNDNDSIVVEEEETKGRQPFISSTADSEPSQLSQDTHQDSDVPKPVHGPSATTPPDKDEKPIRYDTTTSDRQLTPVDIVASTAAEVADTAALLDKPADTMSTTVARSARSGAEDAGDLRMPLFAHEAFGAYETADDGFDHEPQDTSVGNISSPRSFGEYDMKDVDDPTIEKFPSERSSVLTALRKIQSSHDVDFPHNEHMHHGLVDAHVKSSSSDHSDGNALALSPKSTSTRKREGRLSHSSIKPVRSAVSLGSIAEEPRAAIESDSEHSTSPGARDIKTPPTDEDEALTMRSAKSST